MLELKEAWLVVNVHLCKAQGVLCVLLGTHIPFPRKSGRTSLGCELFAFDHELRMLRMRCFATRGLAGFYLRCSAAFT